MKYRVDDSNDDEKNAAQKLLQQTSETYSYFDKMISLDKNDPILLTLFKLVMRVVFVLFCIAMSPFVLIGLILGIIVVA